MTTHNKGVVWMLLSTDCAERIPFPETLRVISVIWQSVDKRWINPLSSLMTQALVQPRPSDPETELSSHKHLWAAGSHGLRRPKSANNVGSALERFSKRPGDARSLKERLAIILLTFFLVYVELKSCIDWNRTPFTQMRRRWKSRAAHRHRSSAAFTGRRPHRDKVSVFFLQRKP